MSVPFLTPIDMNKNEILNLLLQLLAADPGSPVQAQIYYNSTDKVVSFYTGTAWVDLGRLDQISPPTAQVSLNSQKIVNLLDPTAAQDAATKAYVDAAAAGATDVKGSVRLATAAAPAAYTRTGNVITFTANGSQSVDGVVTVLGDRILLKNGAAGADNGLYSVTTKGAGGTQEVWTRTTDADISAEVTAGLYVWVEEGTTNADTGWLLTTDNPITLNTTSLTFTQVSGLGQVVAGAGLTKTGNTLDIGAGTGITVGADSISIDTAVVVRKFSADVGDGAATQIDVTHNLGTRDVTVQVRQAASPWAQVHCDVEMLDTNNVRLRFAVAPTAAQFRVTVHA